MKNLKYLNGVLTVIAVCLVLLTLSAIGVIPKASAASPQVRFATVPVNPDGTISVRIQPQSTVDVNIVSVQGKPLYNQFMVGQVAGIQAPLPVAIAKN